MNLCVNGSRFLEFICLDQCMQSWTVGCVIQEISFNITFLSFLSGPPRAWMASNQARNFHTWLDSYMCRLQLRHRLLLYNLLRDQLAHILLTNNLIPFTLHISHVHLLWLLLINKNISLSEPYAVVMDLHLHIEVFYEAIEERHPIDIGVKAISSPSQYQNRPEEVNEHGVEYRVMVKAGLNVRLAFAQQPEELHDELFELHVTENLLIFGLIKDEREIGVIYDVLDLPDILLEVAVIHLKTKFQVLIVKHSYVGLWVVFKDFDHASRVDQVGAEEGRKVGCIDEDVGAFCHLEILQIPHTVNDNQEERRDKNQVSTKKLTKRQENNVYFYKIKLRLGLELFYTSGGFLLSISMFDSQTLQIIQTLKSKEDSLISFTQREYWKKYEMWG